MLSSRFSPISGLPHLLPPPILSSLQPVPRYPFPSSLPLFRLRSSSLFSSLHPFVSFSRLSSAFSPYLHHRHDHAEGRNSRSVDPRLLCGTHPLYRTQSPFLCDGSQGLSGLWCERYTQGVNDSELENERCCLQRTPAVTQHRTEQLYEKRRYKTVQKIVPVAQPLILLYPFLPRVGREE
jgi:hypothetical protein